MKEMKYQAMRLREPEILDEGVYKDYHYIILSLGTHPCAYVEIPEGDFCYNERYVDLNEYISCHGGLTFSDSFLRGIIKDTWIIGWDYAHMADYQVWMSDLEVGKKWTTKEILVEVKDVIDQLVVLNGA